MGAPATPWTKSTETATAWNPQTTNPTEWGKEFPFSEFALLLQDNSSSLLLQNNTYSLGLESGDID